MVLFISCFCIYWPHYFFNITYKILYNLFCNNINLCICMGSIRLMCNNISPTEQLIQTSFEFIFCIFCSSSFRFGEVRNLNGKGGPRHRGWMKWHDKKAKAPGQHKVVRALGVTVWADRKRLFSQAWVEDTLARVRLFLTSTYLFVIAWRHPPVAAKTQKRRLWFLKAAAFYRT